MKSTGSIASTADVLALTVNEIVARRPESLPTLHALGIDACCGGSLVLAEACRRHGLDPRDVAAALEDPPAL